MKTLRNCLFSIFPHQNTNLLYLFLMFAYQNHDYDQLCCSVWRTELTFHSGKISISWSFFFTGSSPLSFLPTWPYYPSNLYPAAFSLCREHGHGHSFVPSLPFSDAILGNVRWLGQMKKIVWFRLPDRANIFGADPRTLFFIFLPTAISRGYTEALHIK